MTMRRLSAPVWMMAGGLNSNISYGNLATLSATGHSATIIGTLRIVGSGTKTLSAAGGGRILWRSANPITFSNAGTTLRIGVQDVAVTGFEDASFDVYADYVGGTDTLASNTFYRKSMTSGSKTMADGDRIAISAEMISRGGSDSVIIGVRSDTYSMINTLYPYRTIDSGSGPSKNESAQCAAFAIEFDDGTVGTIEAATMIPAAAFLSVFTFGSSSTTDEYAACFKVAHKCTINSIYIGVGSIASTDDYEIVVYSDPFGSPAIIQTITQDPDILAATGAGFQYIAINPLTLVPNTWYAVSARPTTTNTITFRYGDLGSGLEHYKTALPFGADIKMAGRTDQTGPFVETQAYHIPNFGICMTHLSDDRKEHSSTS